MVNIGTVTGDLNPILIPTVEGPQVWGLRIAEGFSRNPQENSHRSVGSLPTTCRSFSEDHHVFSLSMLVHVRILQGRSRRQVSETISAIAFEACRVFLGSPGLPVISGNSIGSKIQASPLMLLCHFMRTKLPIFRNQKKFESFDLYCGHNVDSFFVFFQAKSHGATESQHGVWPPFRWSATRKWPVAKLPWAPGPRWKRMDWCLGYEVPSMQLQGMCPR